MNVNDVGEFYPYSSHSSRNAGIHVHYIHRPSDKLILTLRQKMSIAVQKRYATPTSCVFTDIRWLSNTLVFNRFRYWTHAKSFLFSRRSEIRNTSRNTSQHISSGFLADDSNSGTNILRHGTSTVAIRHVHLYGLHVNYPSLPLNRASRVGRRLPFPAESIKLADKLFKSRPVNDKFPY